MNPYAVIGLVVMKLALLSIAWRRFDRALTLPRSPQQTRLIATSAVLLTACLI
ncbi:MAG TPA: hypothetical protein VFA59_17960 [Vicinamibacterales bacterium]|nr:hypothetical protein [Vicinamibacterales bacterium]